MEKRTPAGVLVAAALVVAAFPASATTGASATAVLSDMQLRLVDLAPDDGIAPAITFTPGTTFIQAIAGGQNLYQDLPDPFSAGAESLANGQGTATASLAGDVHGAGATITITTGATAAGDSGAAPNETDAFVFFGETGFTLSPHTEVEFIGAATVAADVADVPRTRADASVAFNFFSTAGDARTALTVEANALPGQDHVGATQFLTASFANNTDATLDVLFGAGVTATAVTNAVPEPPTGLLLAIGAALAWVSSRRTRASLRLSDGNGTCALR